MKENSLKISLIIIALTLFSCRQESEEIKPEIDKDTAENIIQEEDNMDLEKRVSIYAPVEITADISHLTGNQKKLTGLLVEAGKLADEIFWIQTSPAAAPLRDSLMNETNPGAALKFVMINYGPYDRIDDGKRYIGSGPAYRPDGANFYPLDMTKEEFNEYIKNNPAQKNALESQYTVVKRQGDGFVAVPYHEVYPEALIIAEKLEAAAEYADNPTLKKYLQLRAHAIRNDEYYESDLAWMEIKDNDIDVVIGPIENYEDKLFNYKTAYECMVMVKAPEATEELQMFLGRLDDFERKLPVDKKYRRKSAGKGNILQVVNIAYMGGDCQSGVKTIANSLPNDPRVHEKKGGKKSMFKNIMEAKYDKIVVPIAQTLLDDSLQAYVNKKAFTSFVTLHEVSHTLGPRYVYGKKGLDVRKAMKENYSAIEETKADILGLYNHKHLLEGGAYDEDYIMQVIATYIAGLYRSIRFGAEEAHGKANIIQLNFLEEYGAIYKQENGKIAVNREKIFDGAEKLANLILTIQAEGDYDKSGEIIEKYGKMTPEIKSDIEKLSFIPRDIDTFYKILGI